MKHIKASNWVAETATPTSTGFRLRGTSKGYTTFKGAFGNNEEVFYSAHDDSGNREAGYAKLSGTSLVNRHPTATLVNGVYNSTAPSPVNFSGDVTLACTYNASAFNLMFESLQALDPDGDGTINIPPDLIEGLADALRSKAEQVDLDAEIAARKAGDDDLQAQIDGIDVSGGASDWGDITNKPTEFPPAAHNHDGEYLKDETDPTVPAHVKGITQDDIDAWNAGGSGGASTWDELTGKPTEFPPESHNHEIDDVNGLQAALDAAGGTPAWGDVTGKPTEFPPEAHTHEQSEVDGLEDRLEAIEDSITSGGGFVDAPDDGKLYGRQSEAWAEVVIPDAADPDWADIQNKPTEFTPSDHDQPWSSITDTPDDYPPSAHDHTIANVTGLSDALDDKADADHTHEIADVNGLQDALDNGSGPPVYVDEDAPENPAKGNLWFDTNSGELNLFDGSDWVVIGSGGGGDSKPEGYDDTKAIASGVMTTGEMVVLNDDGTVSVVAEIDAPSGPGAPEVFNSNGNTNYTSSTYDPVASKVVISYTDLGNSNCGTAVVGTVSGDSISFGAPVVFHSSRSSYISSTYDSVSNKVVISYVDDDNSDYGTAVVGTVSGDSISFGSPVAFSSSRLTYISSTYDSASNKVVISYRDSGNSYYGTVVVGTVSGNSIAFGSPEVFNSAASANISTTYDSANNKVVISYQDQGNSSYGTAVVGTVSGDSISFGTPEVFHSESANYISSTYDSGNNKVVIAYKGNSNYGYAIVGTVSGNSITFGSPDVFNSKNTNYISPTYDPVANKVVISYKDDGNSSSGTVIAGTVSGDSITFGLPEVFYSARTDHISSTCDPVANKVIIAYTDYDNSGYGTAVTFFAGGVSTNLTDSNYIGVSTGDYADGAEATVQIAGINADQQGMTIGKQYILPDGSLTTDGSSGGDYEAGTPEVFNSGNTSYTSSTYDSVANKIVISYRNHGNSNYGTAVVGTVSGSSITFGSPVVFNSGDTPYTSTIYDPVNNKVIISYQDNGNSNYGTARVGTVSGNSISFGTPVVFNSTGATPAISSIYDPVANKVVISYKDTDNSNYGTAIVGTVSGNSISFGAPEVFNGGVTQYISTTYDSVSNKVVISYQDQGNSNYGTAVVGTVSGDSIAFGTPEVFNVSRTDGISSTYDPVTNKVFIAYQDFGNSQYGTAIVGTVSGDSITFGSPEVFNSAQSDSTSTTYDPVNNKVVIAYKDRGNSNYGTVVAGTVSGNSFTFGAPEVFNSESTSYASTTYDPVNKKVVISYQDFGNSQYGTAVTYGADAGEPNVFAGTAISSTELNIKDTV